MHSSLASDALCPFSRLGIGQGVVVRPQSLEVPESLSVGVGGGSFP